MVNEIKKKIIKMYDEHENQNAILSMVDKLYRDNKIDEVDKMELYNFYTTLRKYNKENIRWII